jgi:hypothetical protein
MATRAELQKISRDDLIARAEAEHVTGARTLTRDELIDELLKKSVGAQGGPSGQRGALARGLFGLARDLLSRVVERGLHLPDAAERLLGSVPPPPRPIPAAIPTVTLAEIYAAQGHTERAIVTLKLVLESEPENTAAKARLLALETPDYVAPAPRVEPEPEHDEIVPPMLDDAPLPPRYDVDECVALPITPSSLFVYWEIREATLLHLRSEGEATVVLEIVTVTPTWDGPITSRSHVNVFATWGDYTLSGLNPEAIVRVAVGVKTGGHFRPVAHSPLLNRSGEPTRAPVIVKVGPKGPVAWTEGEQEALLAHAIARRGSQQRSEGSSSEQSHKPRP